MKKKAMKDEKVQDEKYSELMHPKRKTTRKIINPQDKQALGLDPVDEKYSQAIHPKRKTTKKIINPQDKKALGLDPVS